MVNAGMIVENELEKDKQKENERLVYIENLVKNVMVRIGSHTKELVGSRNCSCQLIEPFKQSHKADTITVFS